MSTTTADIGVIHEAADIASDLHRLAETIRRAGARGHASSIDALAVRLDKVLDAQERSHRVPPSRVGQRILGLLAGADRHPTPAYLVGLADSVAARDEIDRLWKAGWLESFEVDDITFVALEGESPQAEDLPKVGDEIVLDVAASTPRCVTEVGA